MAKSSRNKIEKPKHDTSFKESGRIKKKQEAKTKTLYNFQRKQHAKFAELIVMQINGLINRQDNKMRV